jgi:hypothetical protein
MPTDQVGDWLPTAKTSQLGGMAQPLKSSERSVTCAFSPAMPAAIIRVARTSFRRRMGSDFSKNSKFRSESSDYAAIRGNRFLLNLHFGKKWLECVF